MISNTIKQAAFAGVVSELAIDEVINFIKEFAASEGIKAIAIDDFCSLLCLQKPELSMAVANTIRQSPLGIEGGEVSK